MNSFNDSFNATRDFLAFNAGWLWAVVLYIVIPIAAVAIVAMIAVGIWDTISERANTKPRRAQASPKELKGRYEK